MPYPSRSVDSNAATGEFAHHQAESLGIQFLFRETGQMGGKSVGRDSPGRTPPHALGQDDTNQGRKRFRTLEEFGFHSLGSWLPNLHRKHRWPQWRWPPDSVVRK